jgi:hypothetical protein
LSSKPEPVVFAKLRILERVAQLDLALHVVNNHVHVRHGPRLRNVLLSVQPQRRGSITPLFLYFVVQHELTLDQQTRRATARIVDFHPRLRIDNARDHEADFCRRVKFAGARNAAFGKFTNQIFVTPSDDVRLDIIEPEPFLTDAFD